MFCALLVSLHGGCIRVMIGVGGSLESERARAGFERIARERSPLTSERTSERLIKEESTSERTSERWTLGGWTSERTSERPNWRASGRASNGSVRASGGASSQPPTSEFASEF